MSIVIEHDMQYLIFKFNKWPSENVKYLIILISKSNKFHYRYARLWNRVQAKIFREREKERDEALTGNTLIR